LSLIYLNKPTKIVDQFIQKISQRAIIGGQAQNVIVIAAMPGRSAIAVTMR